jgi:Ca2+-binding EF-hand superfamily protein
MSTRRSRQSIVVAGQVKELNPEDLEEYRMLSGFSVDEIERLLKLFWETSGGADILSLQQFMAIPEVALNPLRDRLARCFGFNDTELDPKADGHEGLGFRTFISNLAIFNQPGRRDAKLRMAFTMQDLDDDGVISKEDLLEYFQRVAQHDAEAEQVEEFVEDMLREGDGASGFTFAEFQRILGTSDFDSHLRIPF